LQQVAHAVRTAVELALRPLDRLPPWLSVAVVAVLTGLLMLVVVKRTSPQGLIQRARDRMAASIYEMRLFLDAPGRVLKAQLRLIGWLVVYLLAMLPALVVLGPPLGLLYLHLETRHGLTPIEAPSTLIMRIELGPKVDGDQVEIDGGEAVRLTAPLVFAGDEPAVYARLHVSKPGNHQIEIRAGDVTVKKRIVADPAAARVAPERSRGLAHFWTFGHEPPLPAAVPAIRLAHPASSASWLGLAIPWWLYWLGLATILALLLRRRFHVAF
jgi:hypothetical protein